MSDHRWSHLDGVVLEALQKMDLEAKFIKEKATDMYSMLDVGVNKPIKSFCKEKFTEYCSSQILEQLQHDNEYPIVINTSFNLKDQTMVLTPDDAIKTFLRCELDALVLGNFIVRKTII